MDRESYKKLAKLRVSMEDAPKIYGRMPLINTITDNMDFISRYSCDDGIGKLFVLERTREVREFLDRPDARGKK